MDEREVGRYWDGNAEAWIELTRMGCDVLRDRVNTPAFLAILPDMSDLRGLDIGCGEGHNTRLLARRGAEMFAIDISHRMVESAREVERREGLGIGYQVGSALALPFAAATFDFVTAFMSFMDIPDHPCLVREAHRVLRPGGVLQFSISHPCFATPKWEWICDSAGRRHAMVCGDYFRELNGEIERWTFSAAPTQVKDEFAEFRIPRFTRTLSSWLNLLLDAGFLLDRFAEPRADEETVASVPSLADTGVIAYTLIIRCRKNGSEVEA